MPRPSQTEARQAQIAEALARLLPQHGFAGASVKRIAEEAGLATGLVHHNFPNKAAILVRVVEDLTAKLEARLPRGQPESPRARVRALVDAWLDPGPGADAHAVLVWAAIGAEAARRDDVAAVYQPAVGGWVDRLEEALQDSVQQGASEDCRAIAAMIMATIEGSFRLHASVPGLIPPGSAAPAVHALLDAWLEQR